MAVTEALSDEEAYLYAILTDASGLDLAEFAWYDPVDEEDGVNDGCWRARPYQWPWFRCDAPLQIDQCARDVGKSLGIQMRAFGHPFANPGAEMVVTAPELIHLEPITQAIEHRVFSTRLSTEMMPRARSRLTRRPFRLNFITGARIVGRIPQVTGRGVKGLHPKILEADEMQDFPEAGWTELIATLRRGVKGAIWRAHGVTRGVRDKFWEFTQPSESNPWKVHRITAMSRPDWSDEERQLNIQLYGSRESPDYRRNILGLHGDQSNVLFVISRLMRCVDSVEASTYNTEEYQRFRITAEMLEDLAGEGSSQEEQARAAEQLLDFNETHSKYEIFWAGMDVGFTADPSEILVAAEYVPDAAERRVDKAAHRASPEAGVSRLRVVVRIHLERISSPVQEAIILHVIAHFAPKAFGMDATGNGLPLYQNVLATDVEVAKVVRGYNFSSNVIVDIDGTIEVADQADILKEAAITSNVLEYCVDAETEVLTFDGWQGHEALDEGTLILTLNPATMLSEWSPCERVHRYDGTRRALAIESRSFSSLTTTNHRWLVDYYSTSRREYRQQWRTSEALKSSCRIPRARALSRYPDGVAGEAFVELVAWAWTEGCFAWGRRDWSGLTIGQSMSANPENVDRIRLCLKRLFGAPSYGRDGGLWYESQRLSGQHRTWMAEFHLTTAATRLVREVVEPRDKVVKPAFLAGLSREELLLFIDVSLLADGSSHDGRDQLAQMHEGRVRSFEVACALAGIPTSTTLDCRGRWVCSILKRSWTSPIGPGAWQRRQCVDHTGIMWCPQTGNGTFLARRHGTVYFTGNSTDQLRELVDGARWIMPWDREVITQFSGQTWSYSKGLIGADERRRRRVFSAGHYHALDAARMLAMAHAQAPIEATVESLKHPEYEPVYDAFISG